MYRIEIKPSRRKTWVRLSVGLHHMSSYDALVSNAYLYMAQYAIDNQMSIHRLSARVVDDTQGDKVVYYHPSNAEVNSRI